MAFRCIVLCAFLLHVDFSLGFSLSLDETSLNATSCSLICTVADAANLSDYVNFKIQTSASVFTTIEQTTSGCSVFTKPTTGYDSECGSGTQDSASQIKKYTLTIYKPADDDFTVWLCYLEGLGIYSNNYTLTCSSPTTTQQTGTGGEPYDWGIGVSVALAVLIFVGVIILILVLIDALGEKNQKRLAIVLIVVGACVILTAVVTAILLAVKTNVDRTDGSWIAAVVFCALGFLFGAVFCAVGFIKMSKLSENNSKPVAGNSH